MDFTTAGKASSKSPPSSLKTSGFIVPSAAPVETIMEDGETPDRPELQHFDSGTTSGDDTDYVLGQEAFYPESVASRHFSSNPQSLADGMSPLTATSSYGWTPSTSATSSRMSGRPAVGTPYMPQDVATNNMHSAQQRPPRPTASRQPSNAYNPARRPQQYVNTAAPSRQRANSRARPRNPNAEYRAQEKAYVQRIRQEDTPNDFFGEPRTPSLDYSDETSEDGESPATSNYVENDPYDQDTLLYYGNEEQEPSIEELKIPANRERLEWHAMLANVLTGDVVKQEKKRLIGGPDTQGDNTMKIEIWIGVRARTCGRSVATQRRLIEEGRSKAKQTIESIIAFEIKGEAEVGKSPLEQVQQVVKRIEKVENLYPTRQAFEAAQPRAASDAYKDTCNAVVSWHNTTQLINTELGILQQWVGNVELSTLR